jgi:hypothetical protein
MHAGGPKEKNGANRSFHRYIAYQGMVDFQSGLTAVEKQSALPSSSIICQIFARQRNLPHAKVTLPDGTVAYFLGGSSSCVRSCGDLFPFWNSSRGAEEAENAKQRAKKVILYFHGGGYAVPVLPQHLHLIYGFEEKPRWGEDVVVYVLVYSKLTSSYIIVRHSRHTYVLNRPRI